MRGSPVTILRVLMFLMLPPTVFSQTIYAVVLGNQKFVVGSSTLRSGLFRSGDLGRSWEHLGPENLKAFSMDAVDSSRGRILYMAAGNGVHRSLDSGRTWKIVTGWRITEVLDVKVDQRDPRLVYAATAWGLWGSSDAGESWRPVPLKGLKDTLPAFYTYRLDIVPDSAGRSVLMAIVYRPTERTARYDLLLRQPSDSVWLFGYETRGQFNREILQSPLADVGKWNRRTLTLFQQESGLFPDPEDARRRYQIIPYGPNMSVYDVAYDRTVEHIAYVAGDSGVWRFEGHRFGTWTNYTTDLPNRAVHAIVALPARSLLLAGTFGDGVFRRENDRWVPSGLEGSQVWRLVVKE